MIITPSSTPKTNALSSDALKFGFGMTTTIVGCFIAGYYIPLMLKNASNKRARERLIGRC